VMKAQPYLADGAEEPAIVDVLDHLKADDSVERAVPQRQTMAVSRDEPPAIHDASGQCDVADIEIDADVVAA
jgi:hypothetical protein